MTDLLDALLDSWHRNNAVLVDSLSVIPLSGLAARATISSPTVAAMFGHIYHVRMAMVHENAPEHASLDLGYDWVEFTPHDIERLLNASAGAVRDAVKDRIESRREMDMHYDHPLLAIQHLIWHEGYHYGQIKLALKIAGSPIDDATAGPVSWDILMDKSQ